MYESFDDYIDYLNTIKDKIPQHVYEFSSNVNRHNLDSPHSLHDSWISSISVQEKRNKISPFEPATSIKIELLGQMHDRDIVLEYEGIKSYSIECVENPYGSSRVDRRLIFLRGLVSEKTPWIFSRSTGTRSSVGFNYRA